MLSGRATPDHGTALAAVCETSKPLADLSSDWLLERLCNLLLLEPVLESPLPPQTRGVKARQGDWVPLSMIQQTKFLKPFAQAEQCATTEIASQRALRTMMPLS